jgi:putative ATP-binding cassette transporter
MNAPEIENKEFAIVPQNLKFDVKFLRDVWTLLKPYWLSEEKNIAWLLLFLSFVCVLGVVAAGVGYNYFYKFFYDALQALDKRAILYSFYYFLIDRSFLTLSAVGASFFSGLLSIRWRRWLTKNYLQKWLHNHNHYRLQVVNKYIDNPDQRISEDLNNFASKILNLFFGSYKFLHAFLYFISFGYILWDLSKHFIFHFGSTSITIPGYLCWVALVYAITGSLLMNWLGRKLAFLDYHQQRLNADFRFGLIRLRESSEQVSLYQGEKNENKKFQHLFSRIFSNSLSMNILKAYLNLFDKGYGYVTFILGFAVSVPFYLLKTIKLGIVMQISSAFASMISAFTMFIDSFSEFADLRAIVYRLMEFKKSLEDLVNSDGKNIDFRHHNEKSIIVSNLKLALPNGENLLSKIDFKIDMGRRLLLSGASGTGKSTFLRALAGIWTHGEGEICMPNDAKILFLPQKPYLPLGTFKELLCYPESRFEDDKIDEVLSLCHLKKFKAQLNEIRNWKHDLSLGEQQLIAFSRLFLYQPDLIFLDEATSSLDEQTEFHLYESLIKYLSHATLVSVAHRTSLREFHDVVIDFSQFSSLFSEIDEIAEKDSRKLPPQIRHWLKTEPTNPIKILSCEKNTIS